MLHYMCESNVFAYPCGGSEVHGLVALLVCKAPPDARGLLGGPVGGDGILGGAWAWGDTLGDHSWNTDCIAKVLV